VIASECFDLAYRTGDPELVAAAKSALAGLPDRLSSSAYSIDLPRSRSAN